MSTAKFNQWLNSDGTENYKCRAWVNFNGTGTVAIRASGNVSSITDNGAGDYTVNFTSAMSDANYSVVTGLRRYTAAISDTSANDIINRTDNYAAGSVRVMSASASGRSGIDADVFNVAIFR